MWLTLNNGKITQVAYLIEKTFALYTKGNFLIVVFEASTWFQLLRHPYAQRVFFQGTAGLGFHSLVFPNDSKVWQRNCQNKVRCPLKPIKLKHSRKTRPRPFQVKVCFSLSGAAETSEFVCPSTVVYSRFSLAEHACSGTKTCLCLCVFLLAFTSQTKSTSQNHTFIRLPKEYFFNIFLFSVDHVYALLLITTEIWWNDHNLKDEELIMIITKQVYHEKAF